MYLIDQLLSILKELYVNIKPVNKEKIYNYIINYEPVNDSLSTIILKYFGFEGVYVKGVDGLDNETFGSVIYDIK